MRNMKKFLALVLAMLMLASTAVMTTSAAEEADYTEAALQLNALKIMKGGDNGELMLDQGVKRYQASLFFAQALTGKTDTAIWSAEKKSATFADVIDYGTAIDYAAGLGVVKGIGGNEFGYNNPIKYQDMIVMAVRALGYETADMQYPYGHILAATKLDLLKGIDQVNYKADMTRGEVAQLVYNMLNTEIAVVDPLTDKVLYPGDTGLSGAINAELKKMLEERTTLLVEAGFASGDVTTTIEEFIPADEEDEESVDMVKLDNGWEIKAADLGITADTAKIDYLGLPVTLYIDAKEADFEAAYEDGEAKVVYHTFEEYTKVVNLGDGNVKYNADKNTLTLGAEKFDLNKVWVYMKDFGNTGWEYVSTNTANARLAGITYDEKEKAYTDTSANTYGEVLYRTYVIDLDPAADKVEEQTIVEVLYNTYDIAQYITREFKYSVTGENATFTLLGTFSAGATDPTDATVVTDVTEKFLGSNSAFNANLKSVSKSKGEAAMTVTLKGEAVQSGDFMIYDYNSVDNILTVAANLGTLKTGVINGKNTTKYTLKIDGTNMGVGFTAPFAGSNALVYDKDHTGLASTVDTYISKLEAGKDNVKYLAVNGNVIYMTSYAGAEDASDYGFAIVTTDAETMAKLLDMTTTEYAKKIAGKTAIDGRIPACDGIYVDNGYAVVAMLNTTTGAWELAKVAEFAYGYADQNSDPAVDEYDFTNYVDLATVAKYLDITTSVTGKEEYVKAVNYLNNKDVDSDGKKDGLLFMIVDEEDGAYTLAPITETDKNGDAFVDSKTNDAGLIFNTVGKTNEITASDDVDAARVATTADSVIVVIGLDGVEVRTGVQATKKSIDLAATSGLGSTAANVTYYAANANLIVLTIAENVDGWGTGSAIDSDATYYVVLPEPSVEYATVAKDEYTLTISGLYDLKTLAPVAELVITDDNMRDLTDLAAMVVAGNLLYSNEDGVLSNVTASPVVLADVLASALKAVNADDDAEIVTITEFKDTESITVTGNTISTDAGKAIVSTDIKVATVDLTGYDWSEIDMNTMYVAGQVYADDVYADISSIEVGGTEFYNYELSLEAIEEITDPTVGTLTKIDLDVAANNWVVRANDKDGDYAASFTVDVYAVAVYDDETEAMTITLVKVINDATASDLRVANVEFYADAAEATAAFGTPCDVNTVRMTFNKVVPNTTYWFEITNGTVTYGIMTNNFDGVTHTKGLIAFGTWDFFEQWPDNVPKTPEGCLADGEWNVSVYSNVTLSGTTVTDYGTLVDTFTFTK